MDRRKRVQLACVSLLLLAGCNESGRPVSDGTAGPAFDGQAPIMGVTQGGNYVVAAGDTVATIADRTNTPVRTLIDLNNLQPPYTLKSGQLLKIQPSVSGQNGNVSVGQSMVMPPASPDGSAAPTTAPSSGVSKSALPPPPTTNNQTTNNSTTGSGKTQSGAQPAAATQAPQVLQNKAATQPMATTATGSGSTSMAKPAGSTATAAANQANGATSTAATSKSSVNHDTGAAIQEPNVNIPDFPDTAAAKPTTASASQATATQMAAVAPSTPLVMGNGQFGWPVQGRVISKYGAAADGLRNDGINIAAPAGAPVVAAADGVVAYAGNELRGFGNMVLIRHPDGWVTAYAHNQSLIVKKGDTVKRGQTIARVGQTGNVTTPQLHFEIRKGTSAQDPMKYLGS